MRAKTTYKMISFSQYGKMELIKILKIIQSNKTNPLSYKRKSTETKEKMEAV